MSSTIYVPDKQKPTIEVIQCNNVEISILTLLINEEEYQLCMTVAEQMWCSKKSGEWGRGLINSKTDKRRAERTGKLGELAFAKLFQLPFDTEYRRGGDEYDFLTDGGKINIKTAVKRPAFDAGLVKAETRAGNPAKLNADVYVFSFIKEDNREKNSATVCVVGSIKKERLKRYKIVPARVGNHKNYEIPYDKLDKIVDYD